MYIVNNGELEVLDKSGAVLAKLSAGRHFGEISILDMKGIGNRRTASVRSVGFSDLFRLSKKDLEEVIEYYPEEKDKLAKIARQTYENQRRERLNQKIKVEERGLSWGSLNSLVAMSHAPNATACYGRFNRLLL